jgi:hypothetical protein
LGQYIGEKRFPVIPGITVRLKQSGKDVLTTLKNRPTVYQCVHPALYFLYGNQTG